MFENDLAGCPRPENATMGALEPPCTPEPPQMMLADIGGILIVWLVVGALVALIVGKWLKRKR